MSAPKKTNLIFIPILYAAIGVSWIYASDWIIDYLMQALSITPAAFPDDLRRVCYVLVISCVLYVLLTRIYAKTLLAESYYQRLFSENPVGMILAEQETGVIACANKAAQNWYGKSEKRLAATHFFDSLTPVETDKPLVTLVAEENRVQDCGIWQYIPAKDSPRFAQAYTAKIDIQSKANTLAVLVDKTKQVIAEREALTYAQRLSQMQENISDIYVSIGFDWTIQYVNAVMEKNTRVSREKLVGKYLWDVFPQTEELAFKPQYTKAMAERCSVHFTEYYPPLKQWYQVSVYPSPEGISAYLQDITIQREKDIRIAETERYLSSIVNNTIDPIWYVKKDFKIAFHNEGFTQLRAKMMDAPEGADLSIAAPAYAPEVVRNLLLAHYNEGLDGKRIERQLPVPHKDGTVYIYDVVMNPVFDKDKNVIGVGCFARDITDRKKAEEKINLQNEHLRQIAWYQSHIVRGPVASILGLVQIFDKEDILNPFNMEIITHLEATAHQLDKAVKSIVKEANSSTNHQEMETLRR